MAFLHRVLCARPGLGSCPYPLSPLSPFSDSLPSSSPLNNPLQPLQLPVIAFLTTAFASNSALFNPPPPSLPITFLNPSSCNPPIPSPQSPQLFITPSLPLTLFHSSSIPARGSRSSLCDTDAPSCSGRSTWEQSIGGARLLQCVTGCVAFVCVCVCVLVCPHERKKMRREAKMVHTARY